MKIWKNLSGKRVCDYSNDKTIVEIRHKNDITRITVNPDGTLNIKNISIAA